MTVPRSDPPFWNGLTREEKNLEITWAAWAALVFLGAPIAWLIYWLVT